MECSEGPQSPVAVEESPEVPTETKSQPKGPGRVGLEDTDAGTLRTTGYVWEISPNTVHLGRSGGPAERPSLYLFVGEVPRLSRYQKWRSQTPVVPTSSREGTEVISYLRSWSQGSQSPPSPYGFTTRLQPVGNGLRDLDPGLCATAHITVR